MALEELTINTKEARALELVKRRWQIADKAEAKQMSNFDDWFRMFKGENVKSNYKGLSNIVVPKIFEKVERGTAMISQAIKKIRVNGQGQEDKEAADFNEKLIEYEDRILNIKQLRKIWIKSARIHGTGYLKLSWDLNKEERDKPYKGIKVSLCDPKSIRFNPDHVAGEPFRWVIHYLNVPFEDLKNNPNYKNKISEIKNLASKGIKKESNTQTSPGSTNPIPAAIDESTLEVKIKDYYGTFQEKEDGDFIPYHIVVAEDSVVLSAIPNPYKDILEDPIPIFPLYIYTSPHEAYGIGDTEAIASLFTELNDTRNQRMDTVILTIDPAKEVLKGAQIDEKDLVAKKGWIIHSNIPGGIRFIPPDMQGVVAAINEEKIIQGDIDRTLGIPSFGAQTPVAGDITTDTATGVNAIMQAQDIISNSILEDVKESLVKFYRAILAFNQTFLDRQFIISIVGEDGQITPTQIDPARIKGNMDLDIDVELVGNRLARRAEALQALTVGSKIPGTNMAKLWEDYLKTHDKNAKDYYTPPQPISPEPPKVSISLRGELGGVQSAGIYKTIPGVNQVLGDPLFTEEGRQMMRGQLPEHLKSEDRQHEIRTRETDLKLKEKQLNDTIQR